MGNAVCLPRVPTALGLTPASSLSVAPVERGSTCSGPQDGVGGVSRKVSGRPRRAAIAKQRRGKHHSHHYHDICENCGDGSVTVSVAYCFNYSKLLLQAVPKKKKKKKKNAQNTPCLILWALVKLEMNGD